MLKKLYLSLSGKLKPSKVHLIFGVGFPVALHLSEISGPGCKVCSINVYVSIGAASAEIKHQAIKFRDIE